MSASNDHHNRKRYGLIGYPLGHSFSKKYFEEKFAEEKNADARFDLFPLKNIEEFPALVASHADLLGLAVTIPYKEKVIRFLDRLDETAKAVGAVNCIKFSGGEMKGFNTDARGFESSLLPLLQSHKHKALVLGSGGASKAVQYVLRKNNIPFLTVSRNARPEENFVMYENLDEEIIHDHQLIINCTPVGMTPREDDQPQLPYHFLTKGHLLYDLVYKPAKTKFLEQGEKRGCSIKNGLEMLYVQAEENWRIWNE